MHRRSGPLRVKTSDASGEIALPFTWTHGFCGARKLKFKLVKAIAEPLKMLAPGGSCFAAARRLANANVNRTKQSPTVHQANFAPVFRSLGFRSSNSPLIARKIEVRKA